MKRWLVALALVLAALPARAHELHPFARGGWQALRQAHQGKPIVVHFWGVTCGPCMAELPQWGKLLRERPDMNLVLVEADLVSESPARVSHILAKAGLSQAESWAFADYFEDRLRYEVDPTWQGELPRTVLIDGDGTIKTLTGSGNVSTVRAWVESRR